MAYSAGRFSGHNFMLKRLLLVLGFAFAVGASAAQAHPHVWVTMKSELVYAEDGTITGIKQSWAFDDMFSAFALQGIESKEKGKYTREELEPLAKVNVDSLKEYEYFTYVTADDKKVPLTDPAAGYWLDYKDSVLTLNFTLPLKTPVKAKELKVEVYDPSIFVDFEWASDKPVSMSGGKGCTAEVMKPREMTFEESKKLSEIPADQKNDTMAWGAMFANKILVHCP
jgi:ABC-type uncharacterized transport system substrate-binding protein